MHNSKKILLALSMFSFHHCCAMLLPCGKCGKMVSQRGMGMHEAYCYKGFKCGTCSKRFRSISLRRHHEKHCYGKEIYWSRSKHKGNRKKRQLEREKTKEKIKKFETKLRTIYPKNQSGIVVHDQKRHMHCFFLLKPIAGCRRVFLDKRKISIFVKALEKGSVIYHPLPLTLKIPKEFVRTKKWTFPTPNWPMESDFAHLPNFSEPSPQSPINSEVNSCATPETPPPPLVQVQNDETPGFNWEDLLKKDLIAKAPEKILF